ncbi:MAG: transporter substrate-binding domain-containing protein [Spirochaeta sp.]|nr:transporter substrate-binding domain-containing protein [Spirochaeta sp.]
MIRRILLTVLMVAVVTGGLVFAGGQAEESAAPASEADSSQETAAALERTPDDPRLYTPGKLTVATGDPVYPPWMLNNDPAGGEGFENGIIYALAEEMGFDYDDVVWVTQTFDQGIAPGPKPYDFAIQQYSVTEPRKEFVDFSTVYYQPDKAVIALAGSGLSNAQSFDDLREARWGATIGTTDLDYLENTIGIDDVAVYDDQIGTFQALLAQQIDGTVQAVPTALYATAVQVPEAEIAAILPSDPSDLGHGLVFSKGSPMVPWVNDSLQTIIDRGVIEELNQQYLVGGADIPEITE